MKRIMPLAALLLALTAVLNCGPVASSTIKASQPDQMRVAHLPPEVRLRKLHLVRPDLIQYPICFEVYC